MRDRREWETPGRSMVAVLTVITFLISVRIGRLSDSTSVLLIAHASEDVDTPTEQMFAERSERAYAVLMSGTESPATDKPSDLA